MVASVEKVYPVILSGGNGTRLWPISRSLYPKQLHSLNSKNSMLQDTLLRIHDESLFHKPSIIANENHKFSILEQLKENGTYLENMVLEPEAKNTAPAIIILSLLMEKTDPEAILLVMPSDHVLENNKEFIKTVVAAKKQASDGKIVTFGVTPRSAKTGYGYIKKGDLLDSVCHEVNSFKEKPNLETAESYLSDGDYLWNSGMFLFKAGVLISEAKRFAPELLKMCNQSLGNIEKDKTGAIHLNKSVFTKITGNSIDYAIMEKTDKAVVIPLDIKWTDLGEWSEVWQNSAKDSANNVCTGDVININTKNSYLQSQGPLLGTVGLDNVVVVATEDAVLVSSKDCTQDVSMLVSKMKKENRKKHDVHQTVFAEWGSYKTISDRDGHLVKEIQIAPGKKLPLQKNISNTKHWVVIEGEAQIQKGKELLHLKKDQSTYIPKGEPHCIENVGTSSLTIIEVQSGEYDDSERSICAEA